jgi:hypothetical protein
MSRTPLLHKLTGHSAAVRAVAVTADGTRAVSGSDDTTLKVWAIARGEAIATLVGHTAAVRTVAVTPDDKYAISGSDDATLKVWDLESGQERATLVGHAAAVRTVAITPDGKRAISGSSDQTLKVWDLEHGVEIRTLLRGSSILALAVTPDGSQAVSSALGGPAILWHLDSGKELAREAAGGEKGVAIVPRDSDIGGGPLVGWEPDAASSFTIHLAEAELAATPDGRRMAMARHRVLMVFDRKKAGAAPMGVIWALAMTRDGQRAVVGSPDGTLSVWDLDLVLESIRSAPKIGSLTRGRERSGIDWLTPTRIRGGSVERSEPVRRGAAGPARVRPGQEFTARLAAYDLALLRQARKALRQRGAKMRESLTETSWQTGVKVRVILTGSHLAVNPPAQEFVWQGKLHTVDFDVRVRGDIEEDTDTRLKFDVFLVDVPDCEFVPVARVRLDLEIRRRRDWLGRPRAARVQFAAQPAFQTAFASYHAADRANVLTRLDAIQQLTGMRFFYECLSAKPYAGRRAFVGQQILERDLFMLFWSRRAAESREVEWEWRTALERKGLEAMQAQRLEREPLLPAELEPLDRTADGQNLAALGTALAGVVTQKSKIVFLAASPGEHRSLDREACEIEAKIQATPYRDLLVLITCWAVRPDDLLQALSQHRPTVVHFAGHGTGERGIALHDDSGGTKLVTATALQRLFTALRDDIRLVVFNACYSHAQALAVAEVIDCVVGMSDRISDDAARAFAASFYRALGFGRSVQSAFDQGLAAIALEGLAAEHVPRLLARAGVDPDEIYIVAAPGTVAREPVDTGVRAEH